MKKLETIFLSLCVIFAVSCASGLDADASRSGTDNPASLIPPDEGTSSLTAVAAFVNKYAGVYYSQGSHWYWNWGKGETNNGYKVDYKFKDGKVYSFNPHNQTIELIVEPVEAVLPSANKLQLRHADKGEVLVLNMTDEGLESYVSYILEKVSDDVLINNDGVGGMDESLIPYKGTYNSLAQDNKIENYIAIDEKGNVFFHDANVTVSGGRVGITEGKDGGLTILETHGGTMRKIIFRFDEGVYRRWAIDGQNRDETYIGICEVSKNFIEDIFYDAEFATSDFKREGRDTAWGYYPDKITGLSLKLNEKPNTASGAHVVSEGAVAIDGNVGNRLARGDMVAHVSVLKGNTLHIMGRYNAEYVFSDDWKTATYNGQTLTLKSGEIKGSTAERRKYRR